MGEMAESIFQALPMTQPLVYFLATTSNSMRLITSAKEVIFRRRLSVCLSVCWAGFNWWEAWGEIKIEGFGGRPLLVGGLGPWAPWALP